MGANNDTDQKIEDNQKLGFHLDKVLGGERRFETAAEAVSRMILDEGFDRVIRGGETVYDFNFFRKEGKHIVGWFTEINNLVNFVKEAAIGGSGTEQAKVFVGEPGNGKTFFIDYLCDRYRELCSMDGNRKFTVEFINIQRLEGYGKIKKIQSQTFEDPMIFAMNLMQSRNASLEYLSQVGFTDKKLEEFSKIYRPLGACTEYIWNDIRVLYDGDIDSMLSHVRIVPVPIGESSGTLTGKYSARDKITSSATDLLGEEDIQRILNLQDGDNPYKYNVRLGAIARVAGGGIHFSDELFKNKKDLVQIYLGIIQNRTIELNGYRWPIDALIIATSNNDEYNRFIAEKEQAPIKDRCSVSYVSHNTDYLLQEELTRYVLGSTPRKTLSGKDLHEDPNLNYVLSVAVTLSRLPHSQKLTPLETMKLEAGETAGEKSVKTLTEVKDKLNASQDVTKRWGQKGLGHRGLGRIVQNLLNRTETHEGECMFAKDVFEATEREITDYITEAVDREKFRSDLEVARKLYRGRIKTSIYNAYRNDSGAIEKDVLSYINMIIGIDSDFLGPDNIFKYKDPQTGKFVTLKIDERYIESVETRLGLTTKERRDTFRTSIRKVYAQRMQTDPGYNFMDNEILVKAVTEVKLESDVAGASSLVGALSNRTNEENRGVYNRMIETMFNKLGYCETCAEKTIEYFCEVDDES